MQSAAEPYRYTTFDGDSRCRCDMVGRKHYLGVPSLGQLRRWTSKRNPTASGDSEGRCHHPSGTDRSQDEANDAGSQDAERRTICRHRRVLGQTAHPTVVAYASQVNAASVSAVVENPSSQRSVECFVEDRRHEGLEFCRALRLRTLKFGHARQQLV
jgi:hypothetical protein